MNAIRDYDDDQDCMIAKGTDSHQIKEIKNKLKIVVNKLAVSKKEKDTLQRENQSLQREVMSLQNSLRHMVSGFNNSSSTFPIPNELTSKLAEFYKYDCLDKFFDMLCPEQLTMKGVVHFYAHSFKKLDEMIDDYFQPSLQAIKIAGCFQDLQGPIMNVLRKAFQSNYLPIFSALLSNDNIKKVAMEIQSSLSICSSDPETGAQQIVQFLGKLLQLLLQCRISDPPFIVQIGNIGKRVHFNPLQHDPFDGFIKQRQQCFIILPQIRKVDCTELFAKSLVLSKEYDLGN